MKSISLTVNGEAVTGLVEPRTHLADFMRGQLGLTGTHLGCEQGVCGACTVMVDGQPMRSCISYAVACDGADIRTVEGFDADPEMRAIRTAFSANHALQCGFCTPGMLVSARDIVRRLDEPDTDRIRQELSGNLCRCTGYQGIVTAIASVIAQKQQADVLSTTPAAEPSRAAPRRFKPVPVLVGPEATGAQAVTLSSVTMSVDDDGWTVLSQSMDLPHDRARVWDFFDDLTRVAACMPGAHIDTIEGDRITGRMQIKFGPIRASFDGTAQRVTDAQAGTGSLTGHGSDRLSGTGADGALTYAIRSLDSGGSRVDFSVRFKLTGPLAQFGRSGLVKDFASRLTTRFGSNVAATLSGTAIDADGIGTDLNAISLLLSVITARIRGWLGR